MITLEIHQQQSTAKLVVKDGKRGVIRLTSDEARELADLLSYLRTDRGARP